MIEERLVQESAALLAERGADEAGMAALRERFGGVRFTLCSDDDVAVNARPVAEGEGFNLYLVNGSGHCLSLTNDYELAVGVVVATVEPDEEE